MITFVFNTYDPMDVAYGYNGKGDCVSVVRKIQTVCKDIFNFRITDSSGDHTFGSLADCMNYIIRNANF